MRSSLEKNLLQKVRYSENNHRQIPLNTNGSYQLSCVEKLINCFKISFAVAFDLPQRPNEAHIFYGNMSKIVVSLLGSAKTTCEQDEDAVVLLPCARRSSQTDGY